MKTYQEFPIKDVLKRLKIIIFIFLIGITYVLFFRFDLLENRKFRQTFLSICIGITMAIVYAFRVFLLDKKNETKRHNRT